MKKLLVSILLSTLAVSTSSACAVEDKAVSAQSETQVKRVCIKLLDHKTQKLVEKCKDMKVHQKREGTAIPPNTKK